MAEEQCTRLTFICCCCRPPDVQKNQQQQPSSTASTPQTDNNHRLHHNEDRMIPIMLHNWAFLAQTATFHHFELHLE